jgi:hypothetical protein
MAPHADDHDRPAGELGFAMSLAPRFRFVLHDILHHIYLKPILTKTNPEHGKKQNGTCPGSCTGFAFFSFYTPCEK